MARKNDSAMLIKKKDIVYQSLKKSIRDGDYKVNEKLPTEFSLCEMFNVSRVTLRTALKNLEDEGLIERKPAKGTFVKEQVNDISPKIIVLHGNLNAMGNPQTDIIYGVDKAAQKLGFGIIRTTLKVFFDLYQNNKSNLLDCGIFGIIVIATSFEKDHKLIPAIKKLNLPTILPLADKLDQKNTGFAAIIKDDKKGWKKTIKYLNKKGHEKIGFIFKHNDYSRFDIKQLDKKVIKWCDFEEESIFNGVSELMSTEKPTAILCRSDPFAYFCLKALKKLQYRVPEDVSVMGFSGISDGALYQPPLTTMSHKYDKLGEQSIAILHTYKKWWNVKGVEVPVIHNNHGLIERCSVKDISEKG